VSLATGYVAGRCVSAIESERASTPPVSFRDEAKTSGPDEDDSESDAPSEAGDGDLGQVKPSLEEECKLVCAQGPHAPVPAGRPSNDLRVGPRCTK
jgi:hypothetical protein